MGKAPEPHPNNVPGPFYVEYGCCTACDIPKSEAPEHFEYDGENQCYVSRQPQTPNELTTLIRVAWYAELQCIRYRGNDASVLRRFAELDLRDVCDNEPPAHWRPIIRNHVQFTVLNPLSISSHQLLRKFVVFLNTRNSEYLTYKTKRIKKSKESASLEFSWFKNDFHPVIFSSNSDLRNEFHIEYPLTGKLGNRGVGNLIFEWLQSEPERFTNTRWYADDEWRSGGPSHSTLW
jgi:hypothetical protein